MNGAAEWLRWRKNTLDYQFRNLLTFPLPYREQAEPKDDLFAGRPDIDRLSAREAEHRTRYDLTAMAETSSRLRYLEVLTYLDTLDFLKENAGLRLPEPSGPLRWLDVGAKNWSYVPALCHFIQHNRSAYHLDGIEVDAYRRYTDLRSRADYARAHIHPYPHAHYHPADILAWPENFHEQDPATYHVISHFLPFVLPEPCQAWGLPRHFFKPREQLEHLLTLLQPGGLFIITNQGDWEMEAQQGFLEETGKKSQMVIKWSGKLPSSFINFRFQRFGWLLGKVSA